MLGNVWEVCASARRLADVQILNLRTSAHSPTRAAEMNEWMVCSALYSVRMVMEVAGEIGAVEWLARVGG